MTLEQALSIFIVAFFGLAILWGRTAAGRETLQRVFGAPAKQPSTPAQRSDGAKRSAPRPPARKPRSSASAPRASSSQRERKR